MHTAETIPPDGRAERRRSLWRPAPFDGFLVAGVAVAYVILFAASGFARDDQWFVTLLFATTLVPLLWRSRAPVLVLGLVIALQWVALGPAGGLRLPGGIVLILPVLVALGAVAARRPVWASALATVATHVHIMLSTLVAWPHDDASWIFFSAGVFCGIAWGLGLIARRARRRIRELQLVHRRAAAAVTAERARIASELNAIITSALDRMLDETASANDRIESDRARAIAAFTMIEETGVEAMHELRRLLHLLHDDPGFASEEPREGAELARGRLAGRLVDVGGSDAAITIAVIVATMTLVIGSFQGGVAVGMLACLFLGLALCALLWRHRFPLIVLAIVLSAHAVTVLLLQGGDFSVENQSAMPATLVALAAVAGARPIWASIPALVVVWAYNSVPLLYYPTLHAETLVGYALVGATVWVIGFVAGNRRRHVARLQASQATAQRAVELERARLAYELHDVIGHSITIMVLQAAGARRIIDRDPARAAGAVAPIREAGAEALRELEQLLVLLRADGDEALDAPAMSPRGVDDLGALVERTRRIVADTELELIGTPGRLEPSVDAAAYCVVREALTNAVKHAGPDAQIGVTVSWLHDLVRVEVTSGPARDDSVAAAELSGGYGLLSLNERVRLAGGELRWASDGNRFDVDARFPVAATDDRPSAPAG